MSNLTLVIVLITLSLLTPLLPDSTWWLFLIPCFLTGILFAYRKKVIAPLIYGFIAGFIVWVGATLYFHLKYAGDSITLMANLFGIPIMIFFVLIGCIGGLLTGLSIYSGYSLLKK